MEIEWKFEKVVKRSYKERVNSHTHSHSHTPPYCKETIF